MTPATPLQLLQSRRRWPMLAIPASAPSSHVARKALADRQVPDSGPDRECLRRMARPLRIQAPGLTYHVTARGTGRMTIYRDDRDRRTFLRLLRRHRRALPLCSCHAYCLMDNHYHLVVATTLDANLLASDQAR